MDQTIAEYKQLNQGSKVTQIIFLTEYSTLISSVHFQFEMRRRHFRPYDKHFISVNFSTVLHEAS